MQIGGINVTIAYWDEQFINFGSSISQPTWCKNKNYNWKREKKRQQKIHSALIQEGIALQLVATIHSQETLGYIYSVLMLSWVPALYGCSP